MSCCVQISEQAESDLCGIFEYIAYTLLSMEHAIGQLNRLEAAIAGLDHLPERFQQYEQEP